MRETLGSPQEPEEPTPKITREYLKHWNLAWTLESQNKYQVKTFRGQVQKGL